MVSRRCIAAVLVFTGPAAVMGQEAATTEVVDGYAVAALRGYWAAATDIEDRYRFDDLNADAIDAVEDGRVFLTVYRYEEDPIPRNRESLVAHCNRDFPDGGRLRNCRYRMISSSINSYEPVTFDASGAAARLRAAGVTPDVFDALVKAAPPAMTATQLPDRWGEVRRIHNLIIAPVITQFDENIGTSTIDSATCPAMLRPLGQIDGVALAPGRVPGISNEPKYRADIPHSAIYSFKLLSGNTTLEWSEGSIMGPAGERILRSLREIREVCAN